MTPYVLCDRDDELHIHVAVQVARNFHLVQLQLEPRVASLCEKHILFAVVVLNP